ncbi:MAG: hypothetical protein AAGF92_03290 [Myxococcota bacterium]
MKAIGVFVLALTVASPALAGPPNSTIGAKKLEENMVHSGGVGYPSILYEWWNKGSGNLDWGLEGELVYGNWAAVTSSAFIGTRFVEIGLGVSGILRWHLATKEKSKVTNDVAILVKPGILLAGNAGNSFTFGIKGEVAAPFSIDVHDRVTVVTGGFIPLTWLINSDNVANSFLTPLLIRLGVEIDASDRVAPWFFFDLGPGILSGGGDTSVKFAWRLGAGTTFWGVLKGKSSTPSSTGDAVPASAGE